MIPSLVFLLGLIFGSFMNVLIARLPDGLSIITPSSSCPICAAKIKFYDNIPVLSFVLLRGKCRYCGEKISFRYPLVELVTAFLFLSVFIKVGFSFILIKYFIFVFLLLTAAFTDLFTAFNQKYECGIIPDEISIGGIGVGLILSFFFHPGIINSVIGAAAGFLILWVPSFVYYLLTKKEGMGGGDLKLFAMIGAFLGFKPLFFILFFSSLAGVVVGLPFIIWKGSRNFPIPFGPFISLATIFYIFYGNRIIDIYLNKMYL